MTPIAGLDEGQRLRLGDVLRRCVVQIRAGATTGTGFFIEPRQVLTCRHVVAAAITPGRAQHATEQYSEALALVSDHQDATLGLADALLAENWGKPLPEMTGQFHRATGLLDAGYARHPLDARTSWSLMTYSYLASGLASRSAAQERARELWRAPIAAARAIAFDPSQAARWIRLAETLIDLNCLQAAAVISSHATKLALPVSWFAGLADPLDHEIIKRYVPDARARLRQRTGAVLPGVNFRDDASLEPAGFRILLNGAEVAAGDLDAARWYCPEHLAAALRPELRAVLHGAPEAAGPAGFPVLLSFPAPGEPDPLTALVAWPAAGVVTRRMELAFGTWHAAQAGAGQA